MGLQGGRCPAPVIPGSKILPFLAVFLAFTVHAATPCDVPSFDWGASTHFGVRCYGSLSCSWQAYPRASFLFPLGGPGHPSPDFVTVGTFHVDFLRLRPDGAYDVETGDASGGHSAVVADFDSDGFQDLILNSFGGGVVIRLGTAGGFGPPVGSQIPDGLLAAGDFDGDGREDVASVTAPGVDPADLAVTVLRGDGMGGFSLAATSHPLSAFVLDFPLHLASAVAGDMDGDGRKDLILLTYESSSYEAGPGPTVFLRSAGNATPPWPVFSIWTAPYQDQLVSALVSHFPGSSLPALIGTTNASDGCTLMAAPGGSGFSYPSAVARWRLGPAPCDRSPLLVAEVNGDGWPDAATLQQGDLVVVTGDGRGGFAAESRLLAGSFTLLGAATGAASAPASLVAMSDSKGLRQGITGVGTDVVPVQNTCSGPGSGATRALAWVGSALGSSGSQFDSDLRLTNSGSTEAHLDLRYTSTTGEGFGSVQLSLRPGEQMFAPSALGFLRSKGLEIPEGGSEGGSLRVRFSGLSRADAGSAGSRTASRGAGVAYPGSAPQGAPVLVGPLKEDAADRTNLVLAHTGRPDSSDAVLRVVVTSTDPSAPGEVALPDLTLKPGEMRQLGRILSSSGLAAASGFARVALDGSAAPFVVHAIMNDNVTSDGSWIPATATSDLTKRPAARTLVIPAVVDAADYTTELFLVNSTWNACRIGLEIPNPTEEGASRGAAVIVVDLPAHGTKEIPDLFEELRRQGLAPYKGAALLRHVLVTSEDAHPLDGILAGARVQNPAPGGGRYGVYLSAVDIDALPTTSTLLAGLRQDELARSNIAITNVSDAAASEGVFRVDLYDGDSGQKVASLDDLHVPAGGFLQLNSVLASHAPGTKQGWASVTRIRGSGPFVTYAVVNDGGRPGEGTGDGSVVMGQKLD